MSNSKVFDVIKERSSVRSYSDKPIEADKLDLILESARLAPSASNSQPWHFYVVKNKEKIKELAGKMPLNSQVVINSFISEAPVVMVATGGPADLLHKVLSFVVNKKWYYLDVAIALEHMVLTAWDLGIGSCWVGWFDENRVKKLIGIPKDQEIVAMLTLGYPSDSWIVHEKHRKAFKEVFRLID
jgi:nitroreductase